MKFSIEKEDLLSLLIEHNKVVPIRTTLPILSSAFFGVKKNNLKIKTTNLDQTIISTTKITDEEEGSVAIPMQKLVEIVSALPNEEIRINTNEDFLIEINSKSGTYKLTGRATEEFPETTSQTTRGKISLPGKTLLDIINKTAYAASKNDLKPALTGVYFNLKENKLTAVATDGHKLVKLKKEIINPNKEEQSIIIPVKFLEILKSSIKEEKDTIINLDKTNISTEQKNYVLKSRIIKENFPDFNSVIPKDNTMEATVNSKEFLSCLKRISILSNRNSRQIILNFTKGSVAVSAEDLETATSGKEHFQCDYKGEEITTSYNAKYLSETINHINTKKIKIYLNTALSAAIITPETQKEKENLTTLLMPLRINT